MARWVKGETDVEALLAAGDLQKLVGDAANGEQRLAKASVTLSHQELRPTSKGGHYAVEQAVRARFGPGFRQVGALRRRRNELEYPERPGDGATVEEAKEAVERARAMIDTANGLIDQPVLRAGSPRPDACVATPVSPTADRPPRDGCGKRGASAVMCRELGAGGCPCGHA